MYIPDHGYGTIRSAQKDLLELVLDEGEEVEDTFEINNISVYINNPNLCSEDLSDLVTPIAQKHMSQMMIEKDCKSDKTHYNKLYNNITAILDEYELSTFVSYNQVEEVIKKLKENPFSKRCVLTLWSSEDVNDKYATSWVFSQLFIRDNKLIMTNYFRSCDIYNAFPWNCLGIVILQEQIAQRLGIETGEFIVHIGSAHIYKIHQEKIQKYLST